MKLKPKLLLMSLLPMLLMILIIVGILAIEMPILTGKNTEQGLKTAAYSVTAGLEAIEGEFKVERGRLLKGGKIFDRFLKRQGQRLALPCPVVIYQFWNKAVVLVALRVPSGNEFLNFHIIILSYSSLCVNSMD